MKGIIKTASRFDSVWTMLVTFPAFIMLLNTGIALHQGTATRGDFKDAAGTLAQTFAGQYTPYVETAGTLIAANIGNAVKTVAGCASSGSTGPIYLDPPMAGRNGCSIAAFLPGKKTALY